MNDELKKALVYPLRPKKKYPKILIIGHGRHGKDTLAEIFHDSFGMEFRSSSWMAAKIFLYDVLKEKYGYKDFKECYEDRHNHRKEWHDAICEFNKHDRAALAKRIMAEADCYVGMRDNREVHACLSACTFDFVIWVDASERLPLEGKESFSIDKSVAHIIMDNNGTLEDFEDNAISLGSLLFCC